jgi:NADH dehydrogenase [ubiquinone] 1 alpha subcomplex assembly factor 1
MPKPLFDFSTLPAVLAWSPIDDRVMGGRSRSRLRHDPAGHAIFEGEVSLANNGGFASVRSSPGERGLAGASVCWIELRGDNRQFKLSLVCDDGFDSPSYQASFSPVGDGWQTVRIELAAFRASFRGREWPGATPLDPSRIRQVGLLIAARQAGSFALNIKRISLA